MNTQITIAEAIGLMLTMVLVYTFIKTFYQQYFKK